MHKLPVGVLGASGYAGRELCSLVERHPALELAFATANERAGQPVSVGNRSLKMIRTEDAPLGDTALVFSALPHGHSGRWALAARDAGAKAVDLSSDLRPGNGGSDQFADQSGTPYGLTEVYRDQVRGADLVANPGCYPTAILLGLLPLLKCGHVAEGEAIPVSAASGTTGAGASPKPELLFSEVSEDFRAYGVGNNHRHLHEMRSFIADMKVNSDILFTPHLLPVARGILATIVVPLRAPLNDPMQLWRETFVNEPFIELTDTPPTLHDVAHRNVVRISVQQVSGVRRPTLLVLAAIDNLMKGAAGQALQNANLMLGLDESAGLPA